MPICPRCGKSLSSDQALTYHLNRKYKCGTWKCAKCDTLFDTKFALNIHQNSCHSDRKYILPSYDILCNIYTNSNMIFIEIDENNVIHSISPNCEKFLGYKQQELVGKKDTDFIIKNDMDLKRICKENHNVCIKRENVFKNIYVEYMMI